MSVRDKIRAADDRTVEPIAAIPEWDVADGDLGAVSPSADERARLLEGFMGADGKPSDSPDISAIYPSLIIACVYDLDEAGAPAEPTFTREDEGWLRGKNGAVVERVALACMKVAGMDKAAVDAGKDGSSGTPNSDTTTG